MDIHYGNNHIQGRRKKGTEKTQLRAVGQQQTVQICAQWEPQGEERRRENTFKEMMAENFPNSMKDNNSGKTSKGINTKYTHA